MSCILDTLIYRNLCTRIFYGEPVTGDSVYKCIY